MSHGNNRILCLFLSSEIEMLVDDPKDYEELHEMALDQELCIHITEDMLTMSPDQSNGYSGTYHKEACKPGVNYFYICLSITTITQVESCFIL